MGSEDAGGGNGFARNYSSNDASAATGDGTGVGEDDAGLDESPIFTDGADYSHDFGDGHDDDLDSDLDSGAGSMGKDDIESTEAKADLDGELSEDKK